ncbi:GNAT family N-acetyltransferase [Liquorilactobacillus mali]|uniref:GNAT family N-acetyltransferase n=1 Tax=Liquorilactobacillus mali TaxID=1618 RepID=UPI00235007CB|nr:GNAT family N-acetyltransferase [Liquorilactobacillus mali]MDC7952409.1 GNAT family N-acetyltransferase [Liquorilactobacillus mali]
MLIRKATKKDSSAIVSLFNIIIDEMDLNVIKSLDRSKLDIVFQKSFETQEFLTDWAQTTVAVENDKVVGFLYGYSFENEKKINKLMHSFLQDAGLSPSIVIFSDPEAFPNEWYLNSIAVDPEYQGHGIGSKLLEAASIVAAKQNKNKLGLNVDWENPRAEALYYSYGFRNVGLTILGDHNYNHLQKNVKNNL